MNTAIGIDLGGTSIRAALVSEEGKILASERVLTPVAEGPAKAASEMANMVKILVGKAPSRPAGIGIGSPGPLSRSERKIFQTPNLPGFDNFPIGQRVEELAGLPVKIDNDAKCAALGEGRFGAAKGKRSYLLLTFGTGIGGGVLVDGKMIYGKSDGACEIGHMTLHPGGWLCGCGNQGCFEQYVSASAVERRASEAAGRLVTPPELLAAEAKGELWASDCLREVARDLAIATASLVNIFEPEMIVYGGGLFTSGGGNLIPRVKSEIKDRCFASSQRDLEIVASSLAGHAGVLGAASLVI